MSGPIRVLIADDQSLVRAGMRALLERTPGVEVVAEAVDGIDCVAAVGSLRPDVVLMDIRMPNLDGIEATRLITTDPDLASVRVVVLTTYDTHDNIFDAIKAGAAGFLLKDSSPEELRNAVRVIAAGEALLSPAVTRSVLARIASEVPSSVDTNRRQKAETLTAREREILVEVAKGLSNQEIAEVLVISPATARTYVSRLLTKLEIRDRAGLVVFAYESGMRTPD